MTEQPDASSPAGRPDRLDRLQLDAVPRLDRIQKRANAIGLVACLAAAITAAIGTVGLVIVASACALVAVAAATSSIFAGAARRYVAMSGHAAGQVD